MTDSITAIALDLIHRRINWFEAQVRLAKLRRSR
jgi:hypothetical protein